MNPPKPLITAAVAGLLVAACGTTPTAIAPTNGTNGGTSTASTRASADNMSATPDINGEMKEPTFDPTAYQPPRNWPAPCKHMYMRFSAALLASWDAVNHLVEQDVKRDDDLAFLRKTVTFAHRHVSAASHEGFLKNCRQANPVIGARFDEGLEAARIAAGIVSQGPELSPDELATLRKTMPPLLAAVPARS